VEKLKKSAIWKEANGGMPEEVSQLCEAVWWFETFTVQGDPDEGVKKPSVLYFPVAFLKIHTYSTMKI
jgi:hypothetical protein